MHVCCPANLNTAQSNLTCKGCMGLKANNYQGDYNTGIPSGKYGAHVLFKCIFNIDLISTYSDISQMNKGVQIAGGFFSGPDQSSRCDVPGAYNATWTA